MTELPYAADASVSLTYDELEVLKRQYQKEEEAGHVTVQTKFNYAWGLVKSPQAESIGMGLRLLQGILDSIPQYQLFPMNAEWIIEIYRAEATRRRECLYYLALGYYKIADYTNAKKFNGMTCSWIFYRHSI
jgi:mitochondrial fission 1 protein